MPIFLTFPCLQEEYFVQCDIFSNPLISEEDVELSLLDMSGRAEAGAIIDRRIYANPASIKYVAILNRTLFNPRRGGRGGEGLRRGGRGGGSNDDENGGSRRRGYVYGFIATFRVQYKRQQSHRTVLGEWTRFND